MTSLVHSMLIHFLPAAYPSLLCSDYMIGIGLCIHHKAWKDSLSGFLAGQERTCYAVEKGKKCEVVQDVMACIMGLR